MTKVYIVTTTSFPHGMAPTNRIICYAKGLLQNNTSCEVLSMNQNQKIEKGLYDKIPYISFGTSHQYKNIIQGAQWLRKSIRRGDTILFYSPYITVRILFLIIAAIKGAYIYNELCEIPYWDMSLSHRFYRWIILHILFPFYNGHIVISEELRALALRYGRSKNNRIIKIPILVDKNRLSVSNHVRITKIPGPYIFHAGVISEYKDGSIGCIKAFINACKQLSEPLYYVMAGPESNDLNTIRKLLHEVKLEDRFIYLGMISSEEVIAYLEGATLYISNKNDNVQNRNGFSTKLGEVLLCRVPVITTQVGEVMNYLENGISAYVVAPHQPKLISNEIVEAIANSQHRVEIGEAGYKIAMKYFNYLYNGRLLSNFFNHVEQSH